MCTFDLDITERIYVPNGCPEKIRGREYESERGKIKTEHIKNIQRTRWNETIK